MDCEGNNEQDERTHSTDDNRDGGQCVSNKRHTTVAHLHDDESQMRMVDDEDNCWRDWCILDRLVPYKYFLL